MQSLKILEAKRILLNVRVSRLVSSKVCRGRATWTPRFEKRIWIPTMSWFLISPDQSCSRVAFSASRELIDTRVFVRPGDSNVERISSCHHYIPRSRAACQSHFGNVQDTNDNKANDDRSRLYGTLAAIT